MSTEESSATPGIDNELQLKYHHNAVSVPDLAASIDWYDKVLGFHEIEQRINIEAIPAKVAMLRRGEMRVELFEIPNAKPAPEERREPNRDVLTQGNKHMSFSVADAHATGDILKKRGANIVWVRTSPWGSNVFIRDNVGNLIEFVQQPEMWPAGVKEDGQ